MKNHLLLKQATAMMLSIVLVLTALPIVLSAEGNQLDWKEMPDLSLDFEGTYLDSSGNLYYGDTAENWSAGNGRGSKAEAVTEADGNNAVRLTYDSENNNENYNANAVLNIYNPATQSKLSEQKGSHILFLLTTRLSRPTGRSFNYLLHRATENRIIPA